MTTFETNARNKKLIEMLATDKEMKVYRPTAFQQNITGKIVAWDSHPAGAVNGRNFEINIIYSKYFKSPNDPIVANRLNPKNIYHKEILGMISEYEDLGISLYMENNKTHAVDLLQFDEANSFFKIKDIEIEDPTSSTGKTRGDVLYHILKELVIKI